MLANRVAASLTSKNRLIPAGNRSGVPILCDKHNPSGLVRTHVSRTNVRSVGKASRLIATRIILRGLCIMQPYFPYENAWENIARPLGRSADGEAFRKLNRITLLPFSKGSYGRIVDKAIDPQWNAVMAIRNPA